MRVHENNNWLTLFLDSRDWKYKRAGLIIRSISRLEGAVQDRRHKYWSVPNTLQNKMAVIRILNTYSEANARKVRSVKDSQKNS